MQWIVLAVITAIVYLIAPGLGFTVHILSILMFGTLFWEILLILINLFSLKDKTLKRAVSILLIVTVFFIPLMLIDYVISIFPLFDFLRMIDNLSRPAYFLVISVLSIIFTFVYFNRPGFRKDDELTVYFLEKYRITPREKEISVTDLNGLIAYVLVVIVFFLLALIIGRRNYCLLFWYNKMRIAPLMIIVILITGCTMAERTFTTNYPGGKTIITNININNRKKPLLFLANRVTTVQNMWGYEPGLLRLMDFPVQLKMGDRKA